MADPFPTTSWSLVLEAQGTSDTRARDALADLCEAYWFPLYAYVRRHGHAAEAAADLVQAFFVFFLEHKLIDVVRPDAGRFRSFLLHKVKHFVANEHERTQAQKRGGKAIHVSLDLAGAEQRYAATLSDRSTPEAEFERNWARTLVDRVLDQLAGDATRQGRRKEFDLLRDCITQGAQRVSYREVAAKLDTTESAVKARVHRLRRRFAHALRTEIGRTVGDPVAVDSEIRYLFGALG